jgi:hypothetical protein
MNTSNNSNNNNFTETIFSLENIKPNNKKDRKSRNYKAVKKTEVRCEKVDSLISELPNKFQKQLQSLKTVSTVAVTQKKTTTQKPRDHHKTNLACEIRDELSDKSAADDDVCAEHCDTNQIQEQEIIEYEPNTRTMAEYEMDELRRIVAFKKQKAIEDAWLRTSKSSFTVESCIESWYDMAFADALKMNSAKAKRDSKTDFARDSSSSFLAEPYMGSFYDMELADEINTALANTLIMNSAKANYSDVVADAIRDAESNARAAWLMEQYDFASETDHLDSMDSDRFTPYTEWLTANKMADDLRYVTWSQQQYNDSVALDDSKYDELPLHERYTWCSDDSDDSDDSEEDI